MSRTLLALGAIALLAAGCFDKPNPECAFLCGTDDVCPNGYTCADDGWCKRNDVSPTFDCTGANADAAVSIDGMTAPDAAMIDAPMSMPDASMIDAPMSMPDAMPADAMPPDAMPPDAMPPDAMPPDAMPPDAMPPDAMPPADAFPDPSCALTCATYITNCSGFNEYNDEADCNEYCTTFAQLPLGTTSDNAVNTVGCRKTHADLAASNPSLHCPHAGKTGGNQCGSWCENYCHLSLTNCTGTDEIHADVSECMSECSGIATTGNPGDTSGDTIQCRIHYAGLAGDSGAGGGATNCPLADTVSSSCN